MATSFNYSTMSKLIPKCRDVTCNVSTFTLIKQSNSNRQTHATDNVRVGSTS
ncbi:hypothetical protein NIES4071_34210 [Calothrix sp. NIES-4071]|nr:hypothetical protein NIES4071_34210 [Calothrix sp. NIES-4071]BAZ57740.1 hypothetical protein NIES4105_34140 [Calothrix sp. NIES-4105]